MDFLRQDLKHAFRVLARNPLFSLIAILTLALGIGANSAIFSAVYNVILKPLPYPEPEELVFILAKRPDMRYMAMSPLDFQDISRSGPFEQTAAYTTETLDLTGKGEPERFPAAFVSWNFFQLLRVKPVHGRAFAAEEGKYGAEKVVVLSYDLWKRRFASDPRIVGSTLLLNGRPRTVVGIAPPAFQFPSGIDIWGVLAFAPDGLDASQRGARWISAIARLAEGVTVEQAQARTSQIASELARKFPRSNEEVGSSIRPFHGFLISSSKPALLVLWGAVSFVLLIACVNVTNLLLAQAARRESEVAVRTALGARRGRLFLQFIIESLVLSLIAGIAGVLFALWSIELLVRFGSGTLPALQNVQLNSSVFLFTLIISIVTGLVVGIVPALQSVHGTMTGTLKSGARVAGHNRVRRSLAVVEIATALILLAGAGLLIKSFYKITHIDPGFRPERVLSFEVFLPDNVYAQPHQISGFFTNLINRLKSHPEIDSAAAIFGLPMSEGYSAHSSFELVGKPESKDEPRAGLRVITPDYFAAMKIPLLQGRFFRDSDTDTSGDVVIISEAAARAYWPDENPIGQQIRIHVGLVERKSQPRTIVGIVKDVHFENLETSPHPDVYIPHSQQQLNAMMVVARGVRSTESLPAIVRAELQKMDHNIPLSNVKTMEEVMGESLGQRRFTMFLLGAFAALGLFLAAIGTYGILAFQVVQRTQEIGIRLALGARKRDVLKLVLHEGLLLAGAGTMIGLAGVLATTRFLESLVFGISTLDFSTFGAVVVLLGGVALFACYLPARRATKVDPIVTLRYE